MNLDQYNKFKENGRENQMSLELIRIEHNLSAREMAKDRKLFIISIWITFLTLIVDIIFRFFGK